MLSWFGNLVYVYKRLTRNAELRKEFPTPKVNVHISVCSQTFSFECTAPNSPDLTSLYVLTRIRKAIPLEAWTGPEVSRRLRLPNFITIGT